MKSSGVQTTVVTYGPSGVMSLQQAKVQMFFSLIDQATADKSFIIWQLREMQNM